MDEGLRLTGEAFPAGTTLLCEWSSGDTTRHAIRDANGRLIMAESVFGVDPPRLTSVADSVRDAISLQFGPGVDCPPDTSRSRYGQLQAWRWHHRGQTMLLRAHLEPPLPFAPGTAATISIQWQRRLASCRDSIPVIWMNVD